MGQNDSRWALVCRLEEVDVRATDSISILLSEPVWVLDLLDHHDEPLLELAFTCDFLLSQEGRKDDTRCIAGRVGAAITAQPHVGRGGRGASSAIPREGWLKDGLQLATRRNPKALAVDEQLVVMVPAPRSSSELASHLINRMVKGSFD